MNLEELAASVPGILGYDPVGSIVIVALTSGPPCAVKFTLRVDAPPAGESRPVADELASLMRRHEVAVGVVIGYASLGDVAAVGPALAIIEDTFEAAGITVAGTLTVDGERVREHGEEHGWASLPDAQIPGGTQSRAALAASVEAGEGADEVAAAAANRTAPSARETCEAWGRVLGALEGEVTSVDYAVAALGVAEASMRDAIVAWACPQMLPMVVLEEELQEAVTETLPSAAPWQDPTDVLEARDRLNARLWALCQRLPDPLIPQAGAVAAAILWDHGDGGRARMVLDRVQRVQPEHTLAGLMTHALNYGVRPRGA